MARCAYVFDGAEEIDVVLRAKARTVAEERKVSQTFKDHERNAAPREGLVDFFMGIDAAREAAGVIRSVAIDTTRNRIRQHAAATDSERKGQPRFIGEREEYAPFG